eukprot:GILJ01002847.1.p1 GENE.GILJ01002847.1~~GILJ01002847.1.p1  ORF type:complete len:406 (+),score=47.56 GILJ01002847.1:41-1258(+)
MSNEVDETLSTFCGITGADQELGIEFLSAHDWNLENAVNTYMETHAAGGAGVPPSPVARRDSRPTPRAAEPPTRAPIAAKTERLVENLGPSLYQPPRQSSSVDPMRNFKKKGPDGFGALFDPPHHLLFKGSLEEAREAGKAEHKWVLVNIQSRVEFKSHQLNRDTWSDDAVQAVVGAHFIFWQHDNTSDQGQRFVTLYKVNTFPFICIIDPRTGQKMFEADDFLSATDLMDYLTAFLDNNSLSTFAPARPQNFKRARVSESSRSGSLDQMSEEDMLQQAIAASLAEDEDVPMSLDDSHPPIADVAVPSAVLPPKAHISLPDEPPAEHPDVTRIQFRLADGKRSVRRFLKTDKVELLFAFAQQSSPEVNSFDLLSAYPSRNLAEVGMEKTLSEAGVVDSMVMMKAT